MKTTKYALPVALGLIALALPKAARADSLDYSFSGTLNSTVNGTTSIMGTFTIDTATGTMTTWSFKMGSFTFDNSTSNGLGNPFTISGSEGDYFFQTAYCHGIGTSCAELDFDFQNGPNFSTMTLVTSSLDSAACFVASATGSASSCFSAGGGETSSFLSGSATPVIATPEPSSLLLLGSGLLGLVGVIRWKLLA